MTDNPETAARNVEDFAYGVDVFERAFVQFAGGYGSCDLQSPTDISMFLNLFGNMLRENAREQEDDNALV
jgi:hypothetical protein